MILIKEANFDINQIETTMDQRKTNDTEINNILYKKSILKDVQSSNSVFPGIGINTIDNKNINEFKSVEDKKKLYLTHKT